MTVSCDLRCVAFRLILPEGAAKTSSVLWGSLPEPRTRRTSVPLAMAGRRLLLTLTQSYALAVSYNPHICVLTDLGQHVQQLLRTLNLNSPGPLSPTVQTQNLGLPSVSPDVSPVSTTSALLTPPELSPAKPYGDWKFNPSYDFAPVPQSQTNNALLFETDPPHRYQEVFNAQQSGHRPVIAQSADPFQSSARAFGSFEPFSESSFSSESFPCTDVNPSSRHDPGLLHPSWSHQRLRRSSSDWTKVEDRRAFDGTNSDINLSPTSRAHATAHEV